MPLRIVVGNAHVTFFELNSIFGHDTFLLDINGVSTALKVRDACHPTLSWTVSLLSFQGILGNINAG